ncbi:disease resistance protein RPV1 [Eucalyptus grandis]|uniref:disease resistance protein RPV1 n=1 Tax=Eucalyptus grandis TaxID=71139 RepID=UPI00192EC6D2|nr:disease resistance protein RPV1 [Eucalyptus grandis]
MAISAARLISDVAPASRGKYDVFLNFRGKDTRYGFTDFLYHHMKEVGVHVFRDEEELSMGEVIGEELQQAIKNAVIYIPIFSQTYASSKWCLRELALMVDNVSKSKKKRIFPIFLHVEPDDVKLKKPLYEADFKKHEEDFRNEVETWKGALRKVDELKGWVVKKDERCLMDYVASVYIISDHDSPITKYFNIVIDVLQSFQVKILTNPWVMHGQANIVKLVVEKVLAELRIKQKSVPEHLVGYDGQVNDLMELLDVKQFDVRLIEIYGMGGMGKTTIAKVVFNKLCSHFGKYCSFLEDVQERSTKKGIVHLQKKLLSDIGGSGSIEKISDSEEGMRRIGMALSNNKVLVVLDDVDEKVPIKYLIGNSNLHKGSRIIITTRDRDILGIGEFRDILQVGGFKNNVKKYEMQKMDNALALQLFCRHAFDGDFPSNDYRERSREIVSLMEGLPLAIELVGSLLKGRNEDFWNNMLVKLREEPMKKILDKLKISYDDLENDQKQIFLDIACFLFNEKKTDATYIWDDFFPAIGIDVLTKRCLVKILDNNKFWMHKQLIKLGKHIVRQESPTNPGERSRSWVADEALRIIRSQQRKDKVQGISIDGLNYSIEIKNEEFESFKDDAKAWDIIKMAWNLKVLSLTQCGGITTIPDLSKCSSLKRLTLAHCDRLKRIDNFITNLKSLIELEIECFKWADLFPSSLILRNLMTLEFYYVEMEDIPLDRLPGLESLTVDGCELLKRLTFSSENLRHAHVSSCPDLVDISFSLLEKLESFFVFGCRSLGTINQLGCVKNLEKLEIQQCNGLTDVWGLEHLESLKSLEVTQCPSLRRLIDAFSPNMPNDCLVKIQACGDFFKDSTPSDPLGMPLLRYVQEIILDSSNFESKSDKMELSFTIRFHLGVKESSEQLEFVGGITEENKDVTPDSVTYKGLIANVKGFGFCLKRMWYKTPGEFNNLLIEIKSDEQVKGMVQLACKQGLIHLYVEGGVDSEGEYNDRIREMFGEEWRTNTDVYPHEGGAE